MKELTKALHYLVHGEHEMCRIIRAFLEKHKKWWLCLRISRTKGRKANQHCLEVNATRFIDYLYICGRYRLEKRSRIVPRLVRFFAVDWRTNRGYRDGRPVALKMMKHRHQWESEIRARQNHSLSSSSVVNLLAWHVAEGERHTDKKSSGRNLHQVTLRTSTFS